MVGEYVNSAFELGRRRTLRSVTRSAACNNVSPEMSSTIFVSRGSEEPDGGGGGDGEEEAAVEAVARYLERPAHTGDLLALE